MGPYILIGVINWFLKYDQPNHFIHPFLYLFISMLIKCAWWRRLLVINDAEGRLSFILTNIQFRYGFNCIVLPSRHNLCSPLHYLPLLAAHICLTSFSSLLPVCSVNQLTCYCYHKSLFVSPGLLWPILCHFYPYCHGHIALSPLSYMSQPRQWLAP